MNRFETYLAKADTKQKGMIFASVLMVILLCVYSLSTPMEERVEELTAQIETLQTSISKNRSNALKKEKVIASKELLNLQSETEVQKEKITALMSSLYTLNYAFFNEKEFANALDEILQKSINAKLGIEYIKNIPVKQEDTARIVKHKKRIEISGVGSFKEIVSFINHIENLNVLLKFETILLKAAEKNIKFILLFDVYGVGL
jgi:Tfp pilus assembly protein PilO